MRRLIWLLLLITTPVFAQLQLTAPVARLVVQRGSDGTGKLLVSGLINGVAADQIDARLTPVAANQGVTTGWQTLRLDPQKNLFYGFITGSGGWYILTVRATLNGALISQTTLQPVGIGEVFITAGQSNSRGLGIGDNDLGAISDRVSTIDTINHYYPPGNSPLFSSGDPMPYPAYKALSATRRVFPMGESSWGWGELGDYIVNRYNVPVAFYDAGWDSSTIENWINTANGIPACNRYWCNGDWPNLQPYTNLKNLLQYYGSTGGVRAVLWHQGEAEYGDNGSGSVPFYVDRLRQLIQRSRQDFNNRNVPWMIARVSFDGSVNKPDLITKQIEVVNTGGLNAFLGPFNDTIINRNAGSVDVHFRNSQRVTPFPYYYLNPNGIPADMGLSRFARNWNTSLDNSFFQSATPVLPDQLAVTGPVAKIIPAGSSLSVAFVTAGTFNNDNQWQVQLLDAQGRFVTLLGGGSSSPITVSLPGSVSSGSYRIRVVATNPVLPGVPSAVFQIGTPPASTDLQLTQTPSRRTVPINDTATITLRVQNQGPATATNVVVQDRLPGNMVFDAGSGIAHQNGVVSTTFTQIPSGSSVSVTFRVRLTAAGIYRNAAEIMLADNADPDSRPGSGTADGEDDTAIIDIRTTPVSDAAVFTSPNPNQFPVPAVQSNQPTPNPNLADLSVQLVASNRAPALNEVLTYTVLVSNAGGATANNISLGAYLPPTQQFVAGNAFSQNGNALTATIGSLGANSTTWLAFRSQVTGSGQSIVKIQITAASPADPDSTPDNGTDNGEDDTARADVRVHP
ncbi:sialate O-acetylesterase [Arsenicibacter rosenii]|uniref:DUF11 domain-containing protein n=1 Tax=Arsenicibacter rosenii TaxID=1750698 RepID=A0A1S2VFC1_9BACT|nr:sialate O-acetylesterase [Arsenicibacter rosenii]OIN56985.1 hypothetical protein BLX24_21760 [Arsenicibacter rosenii]